MADLTTIEIIHARLLARYGSAWRAKWAGVDAEVVQKDWQKELTYCPAHSIDYALENLPLDFPPTAGQFREICRRAPPAPETLPLLKSKPVVPDRRRLAAELQRLHDMQKDRTPRAWLDDLLAKRAAGERLSAAQLQAIAHAQANPPPDSAADRAKLEGSMRMTAKRVADYLSEHL
jgi:hypothetical protein